jgi:hypothetical protein
MYAICNTIQGDVADAVKAMNKMGFKYPIFQVGRRGYSRLDRNRDDVPAKINAKTAKHVINLKTGVIHKKGCPVLNRAKDASKVGAYLVNPAATGLKTCKVCM